MQGLLHKSPNEISWISITGEKSKSNQSPSSTAIDKMTEVMSGEERIIRYISAQILGFFKGSAVASPEEKETLHRPCFPLLLSHADPPLST